MTSLTGISAATVAPSVRILSAKAAEADGAFHQRIVEPLPDDGDDGAQRHPDRDTAARGKRERDEAAAPARGCAYRA